MFLNGRRLGRNTDPYTPFDVEAAGLRPGRVNELTVVVDSRKDPRPARGLVELGRHRPARPPGAGGARAPARPRHDVQGQVPRARHAAAAPRCCVDGVLERRGARAIDPRLEVALRSPSGRTIERTLPARPAAGGGAGACSSRCPCRAPQLWSPERPAALLRASSRCATAARCSRSSAARVGLRSVDGQARRTCASTTAAIQLRGASIHEDMPGHGAALTEADMDRIVRRPEGPGRERHALALPAERPPARRASTAPASSSGTRRRSGSATAGQPALAAGASATGRS